MSGDGAESEGAERVCSEGTENPPSATPDWWLDLHRRMLSCEDEKLLTAVTESLKVLEQTIHLYGEDACHLAVNAGKDSTAVLHLYMAALARYKEHTKQRGGESSSAQRPTDSDSQKLSARAVYFEDKHDLPEAKEHLVSSASAMGVAVKVYGYAPNAMETYSDALCDLASSAKHAATGWVHLAIIGGGHVTDPHVQGYSLGGTYSPWPPELPLYMRVSPIANWSDDLVWRFLNLMGLRYCPLYDQGFTSLQGGGCKEVRKLHRTEVTLDVQPSKPSSQEESEAASRKRVSLEERVDWPMMSEEQHTEMERMEAMQRHGSKIHLHRSEGHKLRSLHRVHSRINIFKYSEVGYFSSTALGYTDFSAMKLGEHWFHAVSLSKGVLGTFAGVAVIMWIDKIVEFAMEAMNVSFPTAPVGMFLVFIAMCATEFASHALAVRALDFFAQCRNFYKVWVPLFFSAPLVDLPLVLVKTPPDQLAKVILVILVGTIFSILSSSFIVEAIMRVSAPTQDTAQGQDHESESGDASQPAVVASQKPPNPWPIAIMSFTLSAVALAAEMDDLGIVAFSVGAFQLGKALPLKVQAFFPPIVSGAAIVSAFLIVWGLVLERDWDEKLQEYRGTEDGAGLILLSQAAPAVVVLGLGLFEQRQLLLKMALPIAGGAVITTVVSFIFTVLFSRALSLPPQVGLGLAPRFITLPIAMPIAETLGSLTSIAAMGTVLQGVIGANITLKILDLLQVKKPVTRGCTIGATAHALGTSVAFAKEPDAGPASAVTFLLTGVTGAVLANVPFFAQAMISTAGGGF